MAKKATTQGDLVMAKKGKKKTTKKATKKTAAKIKSITAGVRPGPIDDAPRYYSNYAELRMGSDDVVIVFGETIAPGSHDIAGIRQKGYVEADTKAVIVLPHRVAKALRALMIEFLPPDEDE